MRYYVSFLVLWEAGVKEEAEAQEADWETGCEGSGEGGQRPGGYKMVIF